MSCNHTHGNGVVQVNRLILAELDDGYGDTGHLIDKEIDGCAECWRAFAEVLAGLLAAQLVEMYGENAAILKQRADTLAAIDRYSH